MIDYKQYMQSATWAGRRSARLVRSGFKCDRCGAKATEVHHKHYRTLGQEKLDDLEALCGPCHKIADAERAKSSCAGSHANAVDTYASKKYGEDWNVVMSPNRILEIENEFDDWADRKRDEWD